MSKNLQKHSSTDEIQHVEEIYKIREQMEGATIRNFRIVQTERERMHPGEKLSKLILHNV